jgi:hypothetical protein
VSTLRPVGKRGESDADPVASDSHVRLSESRYTGTPRCRICETTESITRHHLIPRELKKRKRLGRSVHRPIKAIHIGHRCNIIKLCRACHGMVEGGGLRSELRSLMTPNELRHLERVMGRHWVDAEYPRAAWLEDAT